MKVVQERFSLDEDEIEMDSELNILILTIIFLIIIWIVWKSSEVRDIPPNFETINIGGKKKEIQLIQL